MRTSNGILLKVFNSTLSCWVMGGRGSKGDLFILGDILKISTKSKYRKVQSWKRMEDVGYTYCYTSVFNKGTPEMWCRTVPNLLCCYQSYKCILYGVLDENLTRSKRNPQFSIFELCFEQWKKKNLGLKWNQKYLKIKIKLWWTGTWNVEGKSFCVEFKPSSL